MFFSDFDSIFLSLYDYFESTKNKHLSKKNDLKIFKYSKINLCDDNFYFTLITYCIYFEANFSLK